MKTTIALLILCFSFTSLYSNNYGKISYKKAINLSGKQRMLSQRIAKIRLLKTVGASTVDLKTEYNTSVTLFERNLKILDMNSNNQSAKVKAFIRQEKSAWEKFKTFITKPSVNADDILENADALLTKCHALTVAIEEESKFTKQLDLSSKSDQLRVETVNIAGKQRMLSQKLCLYYAACRSFRKGKDADQACDKYRGIYAQMDSVVNDLMVSELNNSEIEITLSQILNVMDADINSTRKDFIDNKIPLQKMVVTTNNLLELFNQLTNQYSL